jgi:hypothetical protein
VEDLDKWCNFGFRLIEKMDPKSPEYLLTLYRLKRLTDRRIGLIIKQEVP